MGRNTGGSWARYGCLIAAGLILIVLVVGGIAVGVAAHQNRSTVFEHETIVPTLPGPAGVSPDSAGPVRLKLELHTSGLTVKPVATGEPIGIEADYDPRQYVLSQSSRRVGQTVVMTVRLGPGGSTLMALLRSKLGGRPAMLRISLPRGTPLEIEGDLARSYGVMELGGLSLVSTELDIEEGGIKLSFVEPLPTPMERLTIRGNRGSISVAGLGNASPRETRLLQHIGAVDLDLRGAWSCDAEVRVTGGVAGGSLWLPDNVRLRGLEGRLGLRNPEDPELPQPTLQLSISEHMGRFIVMD